MTDTNNGGSGGFRIDRTLSVGAFVVVVFQLAAAVWWTAQMSDRVNGIEQAQERIAGDHEKLVRLDVTVDGIERRVDRRYGAQSSGQRAAPDE